eukprot:365411-Chlamydomonas_euryale.AAC.6
MRHGGCRAKPVASTCFMLAVFDTESNLPGRRHPPHPPKQHAARCMLRFPRPSMQRAARDARRGRPIHPDNERQRHPRVHHPCERFKCFLVHCACARAPHELSVGAWIIAADEDCLLGRHGDRCDLRAAWKCDVRLACRPALPRVHMHAQRRVTCVVGGAAWSEASCRHARVYATWSF